MNVVSKRIAQAGEPNNFARRAEGLLCPNNLYLAALIVPIVAIIPALVSNFSIALLSIFVILVGLLLFRFFVIFQDRVPALRRQVQMSAGRGHGRSQFVVE